MKPIKAKCTEFIFFLARKIPYIFPEWLQVKAKRYSRFGTQSSQALHERDNQIKTASLLDGDFKWTAVSVVVNIDHEELLLLHQWLKSSAFLMSYDPVRDDAFFKSRHDINGGERSLGMIYFRAMEDTPPATARMEIKTNFCDSCYASVSTYSHDVNYLSLYFFLKEKATETVREIDVSKIKRYYSLSSINPFSPRFKIIRIPSKDNILNDLIKNKINNVSSDVISTATKILKYWNIKKTKSELGLIADLYCNNDEPYFTKNRDFEKKEGSYALIHRERHGFYDVKLSSDPSENLLAGDPVNKTNLDALFIKSKHLEEIGGFDNFSPLGLSLYGSHLSISMLFDTQKQYEKIAKFANAALLKNSNKVEKNFDILFKSTNKINLLQEKIRAIDKAIPASFSNPHINKAKAISKNLFETSSELKHSIDRRLDSLNTKIQVENLRFHRRYSWGVVALIIIQIFIAAITIDFTVLNDKASTVFDRHESKELQQDLTDKMKKVKHIM